MKNILLDHGSGGKLSGQLIESLFVRYFDNAILRQGTDSAILAVNASCLAYTTDSYVVNPIFFPGGNIGKLAVCGTVNDLAVSGAKPLYLSCGFIIEEGFAFEDLESIVATMEKEAKNAGVKIVTGDTKVVEKGACDKIFINTSGIGILDESHRNIGLGSDIVVGDKIIINGFIADHGMAILSKRNSLDFKNDILSDCASLNGLIKSCLAVTEEIHFMRDATRGGLATVLCELSGKGKLGIEIEEEKIPVRENVKGMCEFLGFDPLYVANEGKLVMVVSAADSQKVLEIMKNDDLGKNAQIIGTVVDNKPGKVVLKTSIGGLRIVDMLSGAQLPRIC